VLSTSSRNTTGLCDWDDGAISENSSAGDGSGTSKIAGRAANDKGARQFRSRRFSWPGFCAIWRHVRFGDGIGAMPARRRATEVVRMKPELSKPTGGAAARRAARPLTGAEFLESVRDSREVWIYGERVKDVTAHPAFRNTARMLARMYDALHDPQKAMVLTMPTDTGNGGFTHKFYRVPRSADDLVGARDAIAEWARISYGWMGR